VEGLILNMVAERVMLGGSRILFRHTRALLPSEIILIINKCLDTTPLPPKHTDHTHVPTNLIQMRSKFKSSPDALNLIPLFSYPDMGHDES